MQTVLRIITSAVLFWVLMIVGWAQDQTVEISQLPPKVAATLKARFPGAKITAATKELENGEVVYDVEMTRAGRKHEADLKADGSIVNFEDEVAVADLPAAVAGAVKAKHPGCTIKEAMAVMVIRNNKDVLDEYEVVIVAADKKELELAVSPDGKTIK